MEPVLLKSETQVKTAEHKIKVKTADRPVKKIYLKTHGCQMNTYDSDRMLDMLRLRYQVELTEEPEGADILLVNTCSVRAKAEKKVFDQVGRWRKLKAKNPDLVIGVAGCVASQEGEKIQKRAPYVDLVFGPQTIHRLPALLDQLEQTKLPQIDVSYPTIEKFDYLPKPLASSVSAYVSIMEGCNKYCSYCIVPYTRGEEFSRPVDDVLAEVYALVQQGVKEITFLGQNVNDYRGPKHDGSIADLALLLSYAAEIDGIERLRFTTSHPLAFSPNLIQAYYNIPSLANHLHLPVQSGSDRILALMKRGHTAEQYLDKIKALRQVRPGINISSDFIVGFPGETEADFRATLDLVAAVGFDQSYSFIYSARPGTPAANLSDDLDLLTKKQRLQILQTRLSQQAQLISEAMLGTTQQVLINQSSERKAGQLTGRTENNRLVHLNDLDPKYLGQMVTVKISAVQPNCLLGEIVEIKQ